MSLTWQLHTEPWEAPGHCCLYEWDHIFLTAFDSLNSFVGSQCIFCLIWQTSAAVAHAERQTTSEPRSQVETEQGLTKIQKSMNIYHTSKKRLKPWRQQQQKNRCEW